MTAPSFLFILLVIILCHFVFVILGNFVFVILSNFVLENVGGQSAQGKDYCSTVPLALETLSKAVEHLEAKIESQTITLSNFEAKVEMQVKNLEANADMQATLLTIFQAQLNVQATLLNKLVAEVEWHEPVANLKTNRAIVALVDDDVEMRCVVRGIPLPEVRWTRENGTLESDRVVVENNGMVLRIKNARLSDEDSYVCVTANGVGTPSTQSVHLQVYDPSQECNRIIESDTGNIAIKSLSSGCLCLIKLQNTTGFRVELDPLMTEPISFISEPSASNSDAQSIQLSGSRITSHVFQGKSLAVVVPPGRERTTLSWTGLDVDDSGVSSSTKFVNDLEGTLDWKSQQDGTDKIFWAIDTHLEMNGELNWTLNTPSTARGQESPCQDIAFSVLQIRPDGTISEVQRTCEGSSEGSLQLNISSQILVLLHIKSIETARSTLRVLWTHHDEPLQKNVDGVVAGTDNGAFVIPFSSARTNVDFSGWIRGVTFDWNSRRIYYLKDDVGIMRSNLNGSESEILLPDASSYLYGMTIEPASGNLYYGNTSSRTIRVCDSNAKKCTTIVSGSDLSDVEDIAVHITKGLLFWSTTTGSAKIFRANLDGSNAKVLLDRFAIGLDVDELEDRLYWGSARSGIGSCDMNGQDVRELANLGHHIYDVAVDNDKVYYADYFGGVYVTSKIGTSNRKLAHLRSLGMYITFFGTRVSSKPRNPCAQAKCAHLCVLVTRWSYRCTCPDAQVLNADGKTCNI